MARVDQVNVNTHIANSSRAYDYIDSTGKYVLKREVKLSASKLITRVKLFSSDSSKELESTVAVAKLGKLKNDIAVLPDISQFRVWLDKNEYFSQIKLNRKNETLEVISKGIEDKWNFQKEYKLPKGQHFCFFSQLAECLKKQNLLVKSVEMKSIQFFVIWDNFPYHNELYEGVGAEPFTKAILRLDDHDNKAVKFSVDFGNQNFYIHYDKNMEFDSYHWISQGISTVPVIKE